jgi:hypothetical protein
LRKHLDEIPAGTVERGERKRTAAEGLTTSTGIAKPMPALDPDGDSRRGRQTYAVGFCSWFHYRGDRAARAAELAQDDAVALSAAGFTLAYVLHDMAAGVALIDRAVALNPNIAWAWFYSGWARVGSASRTRPSSISRARCA